MSGTQYVAARKVFADAIAAAEPEDTSALGGLASFLKGTGDFAGAITI